MDAERQKDVAGHGSILSLANHNPPDRATGAWYPVLSPPNQKNKQETQRTNVGKKELSKLAELFCPFSPKKIHFFLPF